MTYALVGILSAAATASILLVWWRFSCDHKWAEVSRTFVEPVLNASHYFAGTERSRHMTGFTTILLKCEECNALRKEELQGHVHQASVLPLRKVKG